MNFSREYERNTDILEEVFCLRYGEMATINEWALEAASETRGRAWCMMIEESGLDAEAYVQNMLNLNGGQDVYLRDIDFGERGIAGRRLRRGNTCAPALRWEWSPPPEENPYEIFQEFSHLCYDPRYGTVPGPGWNGWPWYSVDFDDYEPWVRKLEQRHERKRRRDKWTNCTRKMAGAFPD